MNNKGILIVVSGFSGAGKGTIMKELMKRYADTYALSISATTRKPREGEMNGREYFFKSVEEFEKMIEAGELIEYAKYVDNYYGTPRNYVNEQLDSGKDVILEIEIQGALKVKERFPDITYVGILARYGIYQIGVVKINLFHLSQASHSACLIAQLTYHTCLFHI